MYSILLNRPLYMGLMHFLHFLDLRHECALALVHRYFQKKAACFK
jgi:hypothetical protein